jgi:hypothetical protein
MHLLGPRLWHGFAHEVHSRKEQPTVRRHEHVLWTSRRTLQ